LKKTAFFVESGTGFESLLLEMLGRILGNFRETSPPPRFSLRFEAEFLTLFLLKTVLKMLKTYKPF
jgi:hypothetical protein